MDGLPERVRQELDKHSARVIHDYLTDRIGVAPVDPERLPPADLRELIETIGERMGAGEGNWTLEFVFQDGRLGRSYRHHGPVNPSALDQLGPVALEGLPGRAQPSEEEGATSPGAGPAHCEPRDLECPQ